MLSVPRVKKCFLQRVPNIYLVPSTSSSKQLPLGQMSKILGKLNL